MHIPDGSLCPLTCISTYALMLPVWILTHKKIKKMLKPEYIKAIAMGSAFSFAIMMLNIPIPGGSTGHAIGATFLSILFGPWISAMIITIVLAVQALLFGDGGITTFAANSLIIAFIPSFTGYYLYKFIMQNAFNNYSKQLLASGVSGYFSLISASLATGIILGLQPMLSHTPSGIPLYFPYSLNITIPAMVGEHIMLFGWIEAVITAVAVIFSIRKTDYTQIMVQEIVKIDNN